MGIVPLFCSCLPLGCVGAMHGLCISQWLRLVCAVSVLSKEIQLIVTVIVLDLDLDLDLERLNPPGLSRSRCQRLTPAPYTG